MLQRRLLNFFIGFTGVAFILFWFTYNFYHGERVPVNDGIGWDGMVYAGFTQHWNVGLVARKCVSMYYYQRLLPSFLVHKGAQFLGYDISSPTGIISAFYVYNCVLLAVSAVILGLISRRLKWNLPTAFIAYALIFFNYAILKMYTYCVVTTDISAFAFGMLTIYFYLTNNLFALWLTTFCASFIFPSMVYAAAPLLIFKLQHKQLQGVMSTKISTWVNIFASVLIVVSAIYLAFHGKQFGWSKKIQIHFHLLFFSGMVLFLYVFFSLRYFIDFKNIKKRIFTEFSWAGFILFIALFIFVHYVVRIYSNGDPGLLTIKVFIADVLVLGVASPGLNFVSHFVYYGPGVLLLIFLWKDCSALISSYGLGLILFIVFYLLMGIESESRQLINAWPIFIIMLCEVLNRRKVPWSFAYSIIILSLVISRFWLKLNLAPWDDHYLSFPDQMFFMSIGPWMNSMLYKIFLGIFIITGVGIYSLTQQVKNQHME